MTERSNHSIYALLSYAVLHLALILVVPQPVAAQNSDFTFKRMKVPKKATTKYLKRMLGQGTEPVRGPSSKDHANWFWQSVSPSLSAPSRTMQQALQRMAEQPGKARGFRPSRDRVQQIVAAHGSNILQATIGTNVSPALVLAIISVESGGKASAVSPKGATGLMQLMPATAKRFDVTNRADPVQNITGGTKYLNWLYREFRGDPILMLAAYNAGENAVKRADGVPAYAETRQYIPKVVGAWDVARSLCITPPKYATDGCVFSGMVGARGQ
jgi:hypothetical protein